MTTKYSYAKSNDSLFTFTPKNAFFLFSAVSREWVLKSWHLRVCFLNKVKLIRTCEYIFENHFECRTCKPNITLCKLYHFYISILNCIFIIRVYANINDIFVNKWNANCWLRLKTLLTDSIFDCKWNKCVTEIVSKPINKNHKHGKTFSLRRHIV